MHPHPITQELFRMLRYHKFCCTPQEKLELRFANTEIVSLLDTAFAHNLDWMLRCWLSSHITMRNLITNNHHEPSSAPSRGLVTDFSPTIARITISRVATLMLDHQHHLRAITSSLNSGTILSLRFPPIQLRRLKPISSI
jgi:hypothetical protein